MDISMDIHINGNRGIGTATLSPATPTRVGFIIFLPGLPVLSTPLLDVSGCELFDLPVCVVAGLGQ